MAFKDVLVGKKPVKSNIFAKYFLLFAAIFLVTLTVLGTAPDPDGQRLFSK